MAHLDIGKTAFSGFGAIKRQPLPPVIWGVVTLLLSVGPMLLVLPALSEFFELALSGVRNNTQPDPAQTALPMAQLNAVTPLIWISTLLAYGLSTGALFRLMLKPEEKSWFYMRVGMAEVMLVVVTIVYVVFFMMAFAVAAGVVAVFAVIARLISESAMIPVAIVFGLLAVGVLIWGSVRFSLGLAMSWERKGFHLFDSWALTKGHAFGIFLVWVVNFIVCLLLTFAVGIVVGGILIAVLASTGAFQAMTAEDAASLFTPERLMALWPFAVAWVLIASILQSYMTVIQTAPWAEAYRQLASSGEEAA